MTVFTCLFYTHNEFVYSCMLHCDLCNTQCALLNGQPWGLFQVPIADCTGPLVPNHVSRKPGDPIEGGVHLAHATVSFDHCD